MTLERAGESFSRAMRLSRGRDISRVFRDGLSVSNPFVIVRAHRRGGNAVPRIAFALARRHVPSAVRRNRAKRVMRESFRRHAPSLRGFDIVVISRPALASAGGGELRQEMDRQWPRLLSSTAGGRRPKPQVADEASPGLAAKNAPPAD